MDFITFGSDEIWLVGVKMLLNKIIKYPCQSILCNIHRKDSIFKIIKGMIVTQLNNL